jgi:hypothetical protein
MKDTLPKGDTDEETLKLVEVSQLAQDFRRQFPRWVSVRQLSDLQTIEPARQCWGSVNISFGPGSAEP